MVRPAVSVLLFLPLACFAHHTAGEYTPLQAVLHPLTGLDHLLALLGIGWLASRFSGRANIAVSLAFLAGMLAGFGCGVAGWSIQSAEYGVALTVVALGVFIASAAGSRLIGVFAPVAGLVHGLVHGTEMPAEAGTAQYLLLLLASSAAVLLLGMIAYHRTAHTTASKGLRFATSGLLILAGFGFLLGAA